MKKINLEVQNEIKEFFATTAGSVVLSRIGELQTNSNNLLIAVNEAEGKTNPQMVLARKAGRAEGIEQVLNLIQEITSGEMS